MQKLVAEVLLKKKTFLRLTSKSELALPVNQGACFLSEAACSPDFQAIWLSLGDPTFAEEIEVREPGTLGPGRIQKSFLYFEDFLMKQTVMGACLSYLILCEG